ncbi:hypothetical protein P615_01380 [Brevibacillus laterosporus PE36]|nr:hypothetical protein P615_01380 [Brevibacillus laterosporus PE36]
MHYVFASNINTGAIILITLPSNRIISINLENENWEIQQLLTAPHFGTFMEANLGVHLHNKEKRSSNIRLNPQQLHQCLLNLVKHHNRDLQDIRKAANFLFYSIGLFHGLYFSIIFLN